MVLKWATEFRQPCAINAVRQLFGCRVQQASSMRYFTLSCLPWMLSEDLKKILLLSDSYSSLIALGGSHADQDTIYKYLKTYSTLTNYGKTVILCWIPGHVGILANERADRVAEAALSLPISPVKVSAMDYLPRAKLLMRKEWQEIWNCCDGNKLHAINPTVDVTKQNDSAAEMPSSSTGYRLVTRVLCTHIFLVMTKHSVRHVILY